MSAEREIRELGEWDWWVGPNALCLHAALDIEIDGAYYTSGFGHTACGIGGRRWLSIPSLGDRMELMRCGYCCDALGYPRGDGSPKNDAACRPLVEARLKAAADA